MARPDGPQAAGRDEGTPQGGARRLPDAGIVKGRAYAPWRVRLHGQPETPYRLAGVTRSVGRHRAT